MATTKTAAKIEKPCKLYQHGGCTDGRDHCYRCARHLNGVVCPKGCKDGDA